MRVPSSMTSSPIRIGSGTGARSPAAAQDGTDPGRDLVGAEGLDDVVVCALSSALTMVGSSSCAVITMIGTSLAARIMLIRVRPLDVGQAEVEKDHLGSVGEHVLETGQPGGRGGYGVPPLGQSAAYGGADRVVVLDDQNAGHGGTLSLRRRAALEG